MKFRKISFLKKDGDLEWLKGKRCPYCKTRGRLQFGMHPREIVSCAECGKKFRIQGRPVAKGKKHAG